MLPPAALRPWTSRSLVLGSLLATACTDPCPEGDATCDDVDPCEDADDPSCDVEDDACAVDNGGCGPAASYACESVDGEPTCSARFDVVEYEADDTSTATTSLRMLFTLVNTTGDIPETSEPTPSGTREYYTPAQLGDAFFLDPDGVAAFMDEASYGDVALSGTLVGWFHAGDLGLDADDLFEDRDAWFELACAEVDCATYDVFVLVGRAETGGQQTGWQMQNTVTTSQGRFDQVGIMFMINSPFLDPVGGIQPASVILPSKYYAHELSHTLGSVGHANSLWCTGGTLGGTCEQRPYGSVFSLMGSSAFATHHHMTTKQALGWLDASQIHEITVGSGFTGGDYVIHPLHRDDGLAKGITVHLENPVETAGLVLDRLHVETRAAEGFDRWMSRLDGPSAPDGGDFLDTYTSLTDIDREGVLVYLDASDDGVETVWMLDAHPDTPYVADRGIYTDGNPGKFADAVLAVGETLDLPELDVILTPTAITPDGAVTVSVTPR